MSAREKLEYYTKVKDGLLQKITRAATEAERRNLEWKLGDVDRELTSIKVKIDKQSKEFDEAMKAGYVIVSIVNVLLLGMAGVGKTTIKHILLGLIPPDIRSSTSLADVPVQIHVRDVSGVKVQLGDSKWKPVEEDDLQKIIADAIFSIVSNLKDEHEKRELQEQLARARDDKKGRFRSFIADIMSSLSKTFSRRATSTPTMPNDSSSPKQSTMSTEEAQGFQGVISDIKGTMVSMVAKKSPKIQVSGRDPREVLGSNWIYFTDSGGQPHFHNLMPHFIRGISAALFVHRLSERLDAHPMVEYYEDGRSISASYLSPLTTEDTLKCLVRSMQASSIDGLKPNLIFLGTFLDKLQESSETLSEKNRKLLEMLSSEFLDQLVFYNEATNQLIFPLDAKHPGPHEEKVVKLIHNVVEESPAREVKVPVGWYILEIVLEKLTHHLDRKVLSMSECFEAAQQLNLPEVALTAALNFFHDQHLFHYFPEVLPDVVFCSPQVLLDKLTELVKDAYMRRKAVSNPTTTSSQPPATTVGKYRPVRDQGVVTVEFLKEFPRHYVDGLFAPPDLLRLFMNLLILTPFSPSLHGKIDFFSPTARYYMPSLLDMLPPADLEKHRVVSEEAATLLIRFPNGWPRSGVFCCLQVNLIQNRQWELVLVKGKPKLIAQNCVMLSHPKRACVVTLIDAFSYIEVHINASPSVYQRVCPLVRDDVLLAINASCRALRYTSEYPERAFFCPHEDSSSSPSARKSAVDIPQRHAALLLKEDGRLRCTLDHSYTSQLQDKHSIWIQDLSSPSGKHTVLNVNKHLHPVKNAVLRAAFWWKEIGQALDIPMDTLRCIHGEDAHCLNEMLSKWMHTGKATMNQLLMALEDPSVGRADIADEIREFRGEKRIKVGL